MKAKKTSINPLVVMVMWGVIGLVAPLTASATEPPRECHTTPEYVAVNQVTVEDGIDPDDGSVVIIGMEDPETGPITDEPWADGPAGEEKTSLLDRIWPNRGTMGETVLTFDYEYAFQTGDPAKTIMNRAATRLEWQKLFGQHHFARYDGKVTILASDDHLTRDWNGPARIESKTREAFLETGFENLTLRAGRQILIWGEADTAAITDLVSPRDLSELGFKSLEDQRLGQAMITADLYTSTGSWGFFVSPHPAIDELPARGTAYEVSAPLPGLVELSNDKPDRGDIEHGLRWKRSMGANDVALMAADLRENRAVLAFRGLAPSGGLRLAREYRRFQMVGAAANLASGNFIFKAELALGRNRAFQRIRRDMVPDAVSKDTWDGALGMEYSPASRLWTITLEAAHRHIVDWDASLVHQRRDETGATAIISRSLLSETLKIEYTLNADLRSADTFQKLRSEYQLTDQVTGIAEFAGFTSQSDEGPYWPYRHKHRLLLALKWQI